MGPVIYLICKTWWEVHLQSGRGGYSSNQPHAMKDFKDENSTLNWNYNNLSSFWSPPDHQSPRMDWSHRSYLPAVDSGTWVISIGVLSIPDHLPLFRQKKQIRCEPLSHVRLWIIWDRPLAVIVAMNSWTVSDFNNRARRLKSPRTICLETLPQAQPQSPAAQAGKLLSSREAGITATIPTAP